MNKQNYWELGIFKKDVACEVLEGHAGEIQTEISTGTSDNG